MITLGFICVQCAMREFVETLEAGRDPLLEATGPGGQVEGSIDEHMRTHHADQDACIRERYELEARASVAFESLMQKKKQLAKAAPNN